MKEQAERIYGFDLFRGVGILMVVGYHALQLFAPFYPKIYAIGTVPIYTVECFFVLSGFLIGSILLEELLGKEKFGWRETGNFYLRRWLRTLPAYYAVLVVVCIFYRYGNEPGDAAGLQRSFFFMQHFSGKASAFFAESWSLCIEEWFYFSLPLLLFLATALFPAKKNRPVVFVSVAGLFILACTVFRVWTIMHQHPDFESEIRKITLLRLDAPLYGVIMAFLWKFRKEQLLRLRYHLALAGAVLFLLMVVMYKGYFGGTAKSIFVFSLTGISFCLLMPWLHGLRNPSTVVSRALVYTGRISYSLYLVHLSLVLFGMVLPFFHPHTFAGASVAAIIYFALAMITADLIYRFIEKPVLKWRNRKFPSGEK